MGTAENIYLASYSETGIRDKTWVEQPMGVKRGVGQGGEAYSIQA